LSSVFAVLSLCAEFEISIFTRSKYRKNVPKFTRQTRTANFAPSVQFKHAETHSYRDLHAEYYEAVRETVTTANVNKAIIVITLRPNGAAPW